MIKNMVYKKGCLEFFRHLIIFPNTDLDDAAVVADRILYSIREKKIEEVNTTFSGGLYQYKGEEPDQLVAKADKLMYKAKNMDKNIIVSEKKYD